MAGDPDPWSSDHRGETKGRSNEVELSLDGRLLRLDQKQTLHRNILHSGLLTQPVD